MSSNLFVNFKPMNMSQMMTTMAVGEEGGSGAATSAKSKDKLKIGNIGNTGIMIEDGGGGRGSGKVTTQAIGEEGGGGVATTLALGEEGGGVLEPIR